MHNHGFIYSSGGWRLAPSYDVNVNPGGTQHALAIDESDHTGEVQLALGSAAFYGFDAAAANEILARVLGTWREKASRLDLSRADIALLEPVLGHTFV